MKSGNIHTRNTEKDITIHSWIKCTFFSNVFQINLFILQDCSIAEIKLLEEDDNLVVNEQIDFRRKASKIGMALETNILLALARLDTPNIFRYTLYIVICNLYIIGLFNIYMKTTLC